MSFKDKFKTIIGLEDEYETEFEEYEEVEEEFEDELIETKPAAKPVLTAINPINNSSNKGKSNVMAIKNEATKMKFDSNLNKVIIREPNEYSDAQDIADCLKQNYPVFINLQRLEKPIAKRVVDFLSGTIYAIDGDIQRVGMNLFLCTPRTVETEGEVTLQELQLDIEE
ncbi:MAG TPA: cell division protein SepF [Firmicutes bacterium]|nr:cell division protein SepF [Bacillota bacterium]